MRRVRVAAIQMPCAEDRGSNLERAEEHVRAAAAAGADIVLLQEFFETVYFCKDQRVEHFALARAYEGNPLIARMSRLAGELGVVLPVSFFERANNTYFNSLAMIDAGGRVLGLYRKSHIPDGPGYQEKFYFTPGDTGFRVWPTRFGTLGIAICWDQWFPEVARSLALMGAELLFYPTAIGSEPHDPSIHSLRHWQRTMQGHAAANMVPVIAANRVGREQGGSCAVTFYGGSFIADETGALIAEAGDEETMLIESFDLDAIAARRAGWGLFRDRRPDLYLPVLSYDGRAAGV